MKLRTYTTRSLFALIAFAAFSVALWKWLDGLAFAIYVVAIMFFMAASRRIANKLPDGVVWLGGATMMLAGFFRYAYGPMGGELRQYELLRNFSLSHEGIGWLLMIWPSALGSIIGLMAFVSVMDQHDPRICRIRWIALSLSIVTVSAAQLTLSIQFGAPFPGYTAAACLAVVAIAATIWLFRDPAVKFGLIQVVGMLSILPQLIPVGASVPLEDIFRVYGPGYWMLVLGSMTIVAGSAGHLAVQTRRMNDAHQPRTSERPAQSGP